MSLINALLPLIRPLQITSLNPFSVTSSLNYFTSKRFNLWNISLILLLILLISHGIFDSDFYTRSQTSIEKTIFFIKLCSVRLAHITVLIESFVQRENLIEMINILSSIDVTLMTKLGIDVGHKGFKKLIVNCLVIGIAFFISIECLVLAIFLNHFPLSFISFWIASLCSFLVVCLRYFQIIIFVHIVQTRLSIINVNLSKIDTETFDESREKFVSIVGHLEEDNRNILKNRNKKFKNFDEIVVLRVLFGKLWDVSQLINTCFGTSLLVCIGNDFGTVTLNGYWMYLSYKKSKNVSILCSIGLWSLTHIMCLLFIAGFCFSTVCKANETALIVHKIDNNSIHGNHIGLRTRIQQFSIQLLHQKPTFNAWGFFDVNFTLIYTVMSMDFDVAHRNKIASIPQILGAITTYLVILIQFQMSN